MTTSKHKPPNSAGLPTLRLQPASPAQRLRHARAAFTHHRGAIIGIPAVLLALAVGLVGYARPFTTQPAQYQAPAGMTPTVPAPAALRDAALVGGAPAALVVHPTPIAAPAADPTVPPGGAANTALACDPLSNLPLYPNATCIAHEQEHNDGVTKRDTSYVVSAAADAVRRFFETAFAEHGWTVVEAKHDVEDSTWEYTVTQAQHQLQVEIEATHEAGHAGTRFTLKDATLPLQTVAEPATSTETCPPITGVPIYANATCSEHDSEQDEGVTKHQNTYVTTAGADEVRRFYEDAFAEQGWTVIASKQDLAERTWDYTVQQRQRQLKVEIEPTRGTQGGMTTITLVEE